MSPDPAATTVATATAAATAAAAPTVPVDPRTERTRQVVIAATADLLAEAGFGRITIEAIAERAGVARSTVYRNWPDRVDLLVEAWDELCPEPPGADTGSVAEDLRRIAAELARGLTSTAWGQAVPSLVGAVAGDDDLAQAMRRVSSQRRANVAAALKRGIERGELDADADVDEAAEVFGSRFFYRHLMSGAPLDDAFVEGHVALIIALCGAKG